MIFEFLPPIHLLHEVRTPRNAGQKHHQGQRSLFTNRPSGTKVSRFGNSNFYAPLGTRGAIQSKAGDRTQLRDGWFRNRWKAELHLEGQLVLLEKGDSWVVPKGVRHTYKIVESFTAVEATSPPSEVHARDE